MLYYIIFKMSAIIADIEKWNTKKDHKITSVTFSNNIINFTIGNLLIKLHQPLNDDDFYIVETAYKWTNDLNVYSMTHKPTFLKLMLKLMKLHELNTQIINDEYKLCKMKKELEEYMKTSMNPLMNTHTKTIQLFDNKMIGHIIIDEYMSLYKKIKQDNKIDLSLNDNNIFNWKIIFKNFDNPNLNKSLIELNKKYGYDGIIMNIKFHSTLYPNFPPVISIIQPTLANSLMHLICV